ncbi:MAG TPA: BlaI/MecI/CopY family transcriptional regulator [Steroidobacteraceae bacterium]|nr:BlaI/MecI/CopY family transcriptional regulator [Steroidobacteraceae bacterium]
MKRKPVARRPEKPLTATELEMMNVIWHLGPCTVAQVREQLLPQRDLAYTSVSTIIRILEQKGYLNSERVGRGHLYGAVLPKDEYQAMSLNHMVREVFNGTPSLVVRQLLDSDSLSAEDLAQIKAMLNKRVAKP